MIPLFVVGGALLVICLLVMAIYCKRRSTKRRLSRTWCGDASDVRDGTRGRSRETQQVAEVDLQARWRKNRSGTMPG